MQIEVSFTGEKIAPCLSCHSGAGAVVEFYGVVRELEKDQKISGIIYEIYEPMAER